jgi:hypothetical protein
MGIQRIWDRHRQQRSPIESHNSNFNSDRNPNRGFRRQHLNRRSNFFLRCIGLLSNKQLHDTRTWRSLPIRSNVSRAWDDQSDINTESNRNKIRHRYNKYLYAIATIGSLLSPNVALAQGVGGVSATANPIANSSGSVTNQAIQVLQGPYITNTYGGGVQCQGSTFNLTPYIQFADSRKDPWEDFYNEPQYNLTDTEGKTSQVVTTVKNYPWEDWYDDRTKADGTRWFPDGEDMQITVDVPTGDGVPDALSNGTLEPIWYKPIRTDMKANQSFNAGLSATLSLPLNRKLIRQCHEAAKNQNDLVAQAVANKRLDFELARLKNCGDLKKNGIMFHPKSPYASICADVVVTSPGGKIIPHEHQIPQPQWTNPNNEDTTSSVPSEVPSPPDSDPSGQVVVPEQTKPSPSSPLSYLPWLKPSSRQVLSPSKANPLGVLQVGQSWSQPQQ